MKWPSMVISSAATWCHCWKPLQDLHQNAPRQVISVSLLNFASQSWCSFLSVSESSTSQVPPRPRNFSSELAPACDLLVLNDPPLSQDPFQGYDSFSLQSYQNIKVLLLSLFFSFCAMVIFALCWLFMTIWTSSNLK